MKKVLTCQTCGQWEDYEPVMLNGQEHFKPRFCTPCSEIERKRLEEANAAQELTELKAKWLTICPPAYRETDPNFPMMNRSLLSGLMKYEPTGGRGIGLHGETGLRKTRMMFLIAQKLHFGGHDVFYCSSKRIAGCFAVRYGKDRASDDARDIIRRCYRAEILFLDDLGKQRFSDAGQSEFFDLVETRTNQLKPILWTANATGDELAGMMSKDRGGPIVRRLEDFCEVFHVTE